MSDEGPLAAAPQGGERARERTVTPRAFLIGLLMIAVMVAMTQALSIRQSAADVGGNAPPPTPTYLLFAYVLLAGPVLGRIHHRLALSRGELLLIYVLMLVAGPIMHPIGIGFLLPHATAPAYYLAQEPGWQTFFPVLPSWLGPRDPDAVLQFYRGAKGPIPGTRGPPRRSPGARSCARCSG
jgi:hypothetical protein